MLAVIMFLKDLQTFWCPIQPLKLPKQLIEKFEVLKNFEISGKCIIQLQNLIIFRKFRKFSKLQIFL